MREARELFERVERAARAAGVRDVEVLFATRREALTRFANNEIHQNVSERSRYLSVRAQIGQRTARATTNRFTADAVGETVEQAIALARASQPDPDLPPLAEPLPITAVERYHDSTAARTPAQRAAAVAEAISVVEAAGQTAAGIYSTGEAAEAILNSRGLAAFYRDTLAQFSITAMGGDSSGWAKASSPDCARIDPLALAQTASAKATLARAPREAPPGAYTVILEPAAVADLLGQMFGDFGATAVADQRSFLAGRLGQRLFGQNITIRDDAYHALQAGAPFDGEGVPRRPVTLVERGVPSGLVYCRGRAARERVEPTGHGFPLPNEYGEAPLNIVIEGGETPLGEMIASPRRAILVTRFWYIREVDSYQKIMTGMTRDGTFLIEDGQVVCGLRNFRFNQSLVEMLSNVEALSPAERVSGEEAFDLVAPAMLVRDFHFTEVTRF